MIKDAETFKSQDDAFTKRHEAKQHLESYVSSIESTVTDAAVAGTIKRGAKDRVEAALADALAALELKDATADDYRKAELNLKRTVTKAFASR
jgi:L1 cell adhesion molecule like protein